MIRTDEKRYTDEQVHKHTMIQSEKGITLLTMAVVIVLMVIITCIMAINLHPNMNLEQLTKMRQDIEALDDRIASYYVSSNELPTYGDAISQENVMEAIGEDRSDTDSGDYYIIDIGQIDNMTLNYGGEYMLPGENKYIINEGSHKIYYWKGIQYNGREYHTIDGPGQPINNE